MYFKLFSNEGENKMETQMPVKDKKVNRTVILLIATIATFLTPFMGTSLIVALPTISNEWQLMQSF